MGITHFALTWTYTAGYPSGNSGVWTREGEGGGRGEGHDVCSVLRLKLRHDSDLGTAKVPHTSTGPCILVGSLPPSNPLSREVHGTRKPERRS